MERKSFLIVLGICLAVWASLFLNGLLVDKAHPYHRWEARFPTLGTFSSPAAADLNGDGVLDIVVGAGGAPFAPSDSAVLALDGADGRLLWHAGADAQLFGQPVFLDIDGDGSPDVLIGGRRARCGSQCPHGVLCRGFQRFMPVAEYDRTVSAHEIQDFAIVLVPITATGGAPGKIGERAGNRGRRLRVPGDASRNDPAGTVEEFQRRWNAIAESIHQGMGTYFGIWSNTRFRPSARGMRPSTRTQPFPDAASGSSSCRKSRTASSGSGKRRRTSQVGSGVAFRSRFSRPSSMRN